jgi:hypothetical protein
MHCKRLELYIRKIVMAQTKHDSETVVNKISVSELTVKMFKSHPYGKFVKRISFATGRLTSNITVS